MSMAEKIQRARKKRRWSQEDLATQAHISQSAVSRLESGALDNPTIDVVRGLCLALDMSADYLIDLYKDVEKKMA